MNVNIEREIRSLFLNAGTTPATAPWFLQFTWWSWRWVPSVGLPSSGRGDLLLSLGGLRVFFYRRSACS